MLKTIAQFPFISNLRANAVGVLRFSASAGHVILRKIFTDQAELLSSEEIKSFWEKKVFWQKIDFY